MAKKRHKVRSKRPGKRKSGERAVKKSRSSDKRFIPIAFVVGFIIIVLLLSRNKAADKVIVTNLEIEEGETTYIHFDIKHTFSTEKECYADILLYEGNNGISNNIESLGLIQPNEVVSRSLEIQFPEGDVDFKVDIDCK